MPGDRAGVRADPWPPPVPRTAPAPGDRAGVRADLGDRAGTRHRMRSRGPLLRRASVRNSAVRRSLASARPARSCPPARTCWPNRPCRAPDPAACAAQEPYVCSAAPLVLAATSACRCPPRFVRGVPASAAHRGPIMPCRRPRTPREPTQGSAHAHPAGLRSRWLPDDRSSPVRRAEAPSAVMCRRPGPTRGGRPADPASGGTVDPRMRAGSSTRRPGLGRGG